MQQNYQTNNIFVFLIIYTTIVCCFFLLGFFIHNQEKSTSVISTSKFEKENYDQCIMALVIKAIDEIEKGNTPSDYELSFELVNRIYNLKNERK
jgi:hypothetical protein